MTATIYSTQKYGVFMLISNSSEIGLNGDIDQYWLLGASGLNGNIIKIVFVTPYVARN
jgi:hypothetical protein